MRPARAVAVVALFVAIGAVLALIISSASGGSSGYLVRAVFDNSSFVIPGEDVKVAGVTVGTIQSVELTANNKAALVLRITNPRFQDFRTDAHCEIGLESLLGEQFVQCTPTQVRAAGEPTAPPLAVTPSGPNQGQHVLPVENTTAPVGLDLLNNVMRLPQQQKFQLIISGLGAGLAGNGQALNAALKRADPALQQTDSVIAVLASQNRLLARLTDESARVLAPLAAQRSHLAGFFQHAGRVAVASAQEGPAIAQGLRDFPPFLRQFTPAVQRFGNLASQITPAVQELQAQAPSINATTAGLGPLARASIPAFKTLGTLAQKGERVFPKLYPEATQLLSLSKPLLPLATDIAAIAQSFDNAGGIENVMRFIYYYTGTVNGENALGHYIRSDVVITSNTRTSALTPSFSAQFSCTNATAGCGRKVPVAQASAARDASASSALLHYLLAP